MLMGMIGMGMGNWDGMQMGIEMGKETPGIGMGIRNGNGDENGDEDRDPGDGDGDWEWEQAFNHFLYYLLYSISKTIYIRILCTVSAMATCKSLYYCTLEM